MKFHFVRFIVLLALLSACGYVKPADTATLEPSPSVPLLVSSPTFTLPPALTSTDLPDAFDTASPLPPATPTLDPDAWMNMPVIPGAISQRARDIYAFGQTLGNNPKAFSKIGDCDTSASWFVEAFDKGPGNYSLGSYTSLEPVIAQFQGSYARKSVAARQGFVAASVLSPLWSDPGKCKSNESPLACEIRINRPSFAFILLGTNDFNHEQEFEPNMRTILDTLIAQGVVPILATKADNLEGDNSINATIVRLAYEYDIPLWNFWKAVQPLPSHGLQSDHSHLTFAAPFFDDPVRMKAAWPWRNLTALQILDTVWRAVTGQP